ncbi:MAG: hypothetical protein V1845_00595 [bacterium]
MENIIICDEEKLKEIEKRFQEGGLDKVHILADFDKTLIRAFVDGKEAPSVISVLRDGSYLTPDYARKAQELYDKYHPLEKDPNISGEEKKRLMAEWWNTHFELLINSGLNKKDIEKVIRSGKIKFRDGFSELADFSKDNNIPLVIMSSAGLGQESISQRLEQEGKLYSNIYIISNSFEWDKNGKAIAVKQPIIHGANKDETLVQNFPEIFKAIKDKKNVILLGDNLDDVGMVEGFDYDNLIKIGFFNGKTKEGEDIYKSVYDILVLNDSSLDFVSHFLKRIPSRA